MFGIRVYGEPLQDVLYREVVGFISKFILMAGVKVQRAVPVTASDVFEGTCHADLNIRNIADGSV